MILQGYYPKETIGSFFTSFLPEMQRRNEDFKCNGESNPHFGQLQQRLLDGNDEVTCSWETETLLGAPPQHEVEWQSAITLSRPDDFGVAVFAHGNPRMIRNIPPPHFGIQWENVVSQDRDPRVQKSRILVEGEKLFPSLQGLMGVIATQLGRSVEYVQATCDERWTEPRPGNPRDAEKGRECRVKIFRRGTDIPITIRADEAGLEPEPAESGERWRCSYNTDEPIETRGRGTSKIAAQRDALRELVNNASGFGTFTCGKAQ